MSPCKKSLGLLAVLLPYSVPLQAQTIVEAEAVVGQPFGVGRIVLEIPKEALPEPLGAAGVSISDAAGRVLYPATATGSAGERVGALALGLLRDPAAQQAVRGLITRPPRVTLHFLFTGQEPLKVRIEARQAYEAPVPTRRDPRRHDLLLAGWWRDYTPRPKLFEKKPDLPPVVEDYLQTMLARRLNLTLARPPRETSWQDQLRQELGLMLSNESIHEAVLRDRMLGQLDLTSPADRPLPESIRPPELEIPEPPADVKVEPLAMRVPEECLYIRLQTVSNLMWFRGTLERWKGDLRNLVSTRGLDYEPIQKTEEEMTLRQGTLKDMLGSALTGMLGNVVVTDVAMIGTDQYQREGASMGVLFHARNNMLMANEITRQRVDAVKNAGATDEKIQVLGHDVSFLSTPDNRIRSFYAADGDFHFVTTSKTLVTRFLEIGSGKGSLGATKEFRHVRSIIPADRDDSAFIYLSDAFFRNLVSPRYRIELIRRIEAEADLKLAQMAALAAVAEGRVAKSEQATIQQLKAAGLLPAEFGRRPDGSRTVLAGGQLVDSLRGRRGNFMPIPDVDITGVTAAEAQDYERFKQYYLAEWGRVDPMMIALQRKTLEGNRERIVADARVMPLAKRNFDRIIRHLGPADNQCLAPIPGDVAAGEVILDKQRLFFGIQDFGLPFQMIDGRPVPNGRLRDLIVGYLGSTGDVGLFSFLDRLIPLPVDPRGLIPRLDGRGPGPGILRGDGPGPLGMARRQNDQFTVFSFQPELLDAVMRQLRFVEAERSAQGRLRIGDVSHARITPTLNGLGYSRSRETSLGNLRLIASLQQQLHVPARDARTAVESILGAKLVCPLGGQYVYQEAPDGSRQWVSTAVKGDAGGQGLLGAQAPEGYEAPPLNWFRGLAVDAAVTPAGITAHAEIDMQLPGPPPEKRP